MSITQIWKLQRPIDGQRGPYLAYVEDGVARLIPFSVARSYDVLFGDDDRIYVKAFLGDDLNLVIVEKVADQPW